MGFILYNVTHLIPTSCNRANCGIVISDDGRTLSPGRHRYMDKVSDLTRDSAKRRVSHDGVDYEILRVIDTGTGAITSPGDREKMEAIIKEHQSEIQNKYETKIRGEKDLIEKKDQRFHDLKLKEETNALEKEKQEDATFELFKKVTDREGFVEDGVPKTVHIIEEGSKTFTKEEKKPEEPLSFSQQMVQEDVEFMKHAEEVKHEEVKPATVPDDVTFDDFSDVGTQEAPKVVTIQNTSKKRGGRKKKGI